MDIDTNVVSELRRAKPSPRVRAFVAGRSGDELFTSDVTFAEARFGVEQIDDAVRRADVAHRLDRTLRPLFVNRVLSITEDVRLRWRLMLEAGRRKGHTCSEPDLLVAALAALAGLIVVSRDTSELVTTGVPAFDPWTRTLHAGNRASGLSDADAPDALARVVALRPG